MNSVIEADLVGVAIRSLLADLNEGIDPNEPMRSLDDFYGPGVETFLRNVAQAYGGQVALLRHDDPQAALQEEFKLVTRGDGHAIYQFTDENGLHCVAVWSCGFYIDSAAIFVFGHSAGIGLPKLRYWGGSPVLGDYAL